MPMAPLLSVRDLSIAFGTGRPVVERVSFDLRPGEVLGLVGESGSGKTSVALSLLGHRPPGARLVGQILMEGRDLLGMGPEELRPWRGRRIAYVPQNPTTALNPARRIGALLTEHLLSHRFAQDRQAARQHAARALAEMGLPEAQAMLDRYPHQLSGGQQQRVVLALAALCNPAVLVLDEPTTGLDVTTQANVIAQLRRLRDERRIAMVYVTHDLNLLAEIATRLAVLYAGQMAEEGPAPEVFGAPIHPYTRGLLAARPRLGGDGLPAPPLRGLLRREELPEGCPFAPRCNRAVVACHTERQDLAPVAPGRLVACHRWDVPDPVASLPPPGTRAVRPTIEAPVLDAAGLSVRYGRGLLDWRRVGPLGLHPLSFQLAAGEVLAVVGESGSGKSTLARALAGLLPFSGHLMLSGEPLLPGLDRRPRDILRRIQIVFQNPDAALNPRRRIRQILADALLAFERTSPAEVSRCLSRAMAEVHLPEGHLDRFPDQLSGGERQRVAIARALIAGPEVLICDEVLSALDASVQAGVLELLRDLAARGLAILFISHDLAVVRRIADRVLVLYRGRHLAEIPAEALLDPPFHPYVHELLSAIPGEALVPPASPSPSRRVATAAGCPFAPRCPLYQGTACDAGLPDWSEGPSRSRCHAQRQPPSPPSERLAAG